MEGARPLQNVFLREAGEGRPRDFLYMLLGGTGSTHLEKKFEGNGGVVKSSGGGRVLRALALTSWEIFVLSYWEDKLRNTHMSYYITTKVKPKTIRSIHLEGVIY